MDDDDLGEGVRRLDAGGFQALVSEIQSNKTGPFPPCPVCDQVPDHISITRVQHLYPNLQENNGMSVKWYPCLHEAWQVRETMS